MTANIAICDDDKRIREQVVDIVLRKWGVQHSVHQFEDGADLVNHYRGKKEPFDVILLDIRMNRVDGLTAAKMIRQVDNYAVIILLTSFHDYAMDGYEVQAFRYMVKPVTEQKLLETLMEAFKRVEREEDTITLKYGKEYSRVILPNVTHVEVEAERLKFYLLSGKNYKTCATLKDYYPLLATRCFVYIHSGCVVNLRCVAALDSRTKVMTLRNGTELRMSTRRASAIATAFFKMQRGEYQ